jgi:four helix bundle protein
MTDGRPTPKPIESFEDLMVFQRAYRVSLDVHRFSLILPKIEQFSLGDQVRRTSKSICANLAEGFGKRRHSAEVKRYIQISLGSADEMRVSLRYCYDLGYLDEETWKSWRNEYQEIAKMLQGLHHSWS